MNKRFFSFLTALIFSQTIFFTSGYCSEIYVKPCGNAVGIKMYTEGLLVLEVCSVEDISGNLCSNTQLRKGDIILGANSQKIQTIPALQNIINKTSENITLSVKRNNKVIDAVVTPIKTDSGNTLGLWLRDSTAGVGTLTYYNPETRIFGALGHGICDIDTLQIMPFSRGSITDCDVTNVIKSSHGSVGELKCSFYHKNIGEIFTNSSYGIYGKSDMNLTDNEAIRVADADEIKTGDAYILAETDGNGVKKYSIEIKKVNDSSDDGRNMVIEITDEELLEKTGGIVQGMSGAPIIQNNLFVGAVTHVFINNPTRGYGIFAENMMAEVN